MRKPLVFISHITSEKEIASALKELVEESFMGMIEVFVSSDPESIALGGKWLEKITDGLKTCVIEIVLASPTSVKRPWINFEAGAGYVRGIPVIPLCHSGMKPSTLPEPLQSLQAAVATDVEQLERLYSVLATVLDCKCPSVQAAKFIEKVEWFEKTSAKLAVAERESLTAETDGLRDYEIAGIIAVAEESSVPGNAVWPNKIIDRMQNAGYREVAASLALSGLERKGLVETTSESTGNFDEKSLVVKLIPNGWSWLESNAEKIELRYPDECPPPPAPTEEDIPF